MTCVDEPLHEHNHFRNVPGGSGLNRRTGATQHVIRPRKRSFVCRGNGPPRAVLNKRLRDDFVVDVGDVAAEHHVVAACTQPSAQHVEIDPRPDVTHVWGSLHRRATQVHRRLTRDERHELPHGARGGVVEAQGHPREPTGAGFDLVSRACRLARP